MAHFYQKIASPAGRIHALADVGIDRALIPMIAQGLIAPGGEAPRRTVPVAPCRPEHRSDAANDAEPPSVAA